MNLIFTEEFISSIHAPVSPFERSYIKLLSTKPELYRIRNKIEDILSKYPLEKRNSMSNLIKSFSDIECRSHINELYVYDNLIDNFSSVDVEPPLSIVNNKTPDFWVNESIAFEVASIFEQINPHEYSIIETLNSIKSEIKIVLNVIENIPEDGSPKLREIRTYFTNLFNMKSNIESPEEFVYQSSQGIMISGYLYKGRIEYSTVESRSFDLSEDEPDYKNTVRKIIRKKLSKYREISKGGFPIVLVLYNINDWLDKEDFIEVLFGDIGCNINHQGNLVEFRQNNGVFSSHKNTSLSAILIKDYTTENEFYLAENPFARIPLGKEKDIIIKAFNTKNLIV